MSVSRLEAIQRRHPSLRATTDYDDVLADRAIDAVVIATPVHTHADLARRALLAGKHVLIEKPMTTDQRGLVLQVDHTFVYTGAVRRIKQLIDSDELGRLYYYDSVRVNLGLIQHDVSVIWDLAAHDLSIMDYLVEQRPRRISAVGSAHLPGRMPDVAYLTVNFDDDLIAHFHVNWLSPVKVRQILVSGDRRMVLYNDIEPTEKVKVYDKGVRWDSEPDSVRQEVSVAYRLGDMYAPVLDQTEALTTECAHFVECVRNGTTPISDGASGLRVVQWLEAAERSLAEDGRPQCIG
jgi:predicted dehydrogenase